MADVSHPKRQREEEISLEQDQNPHESIKRQKKYNQLLSILEEDEEDLNTDNLSDIFTTLQQELSSSADFSLNYDNISLPSFDVSEADQEPHKTPTCFASAKSISTQILKNETEEDERYNDVMRHLLEASDDELGLPGDGVSAGNVAGAGSGAGGDNGIFMNDGLFEFEDETANYNAMLQSELFM